MLEMHERKLIPSRRRRIPREIEQWGATASAILIFLCLCVSSIDAFAFGIRSFVTQPKMLAVATSFRRNRPASTVTRLQMILSMSTEPSTASSSSNATGCPSLIASSKLEVVVHDSENDFADASSSHGIDDDLDQDLFEKQASEQRARLEEILQSSPPHLLESSTSMQLRDFDHSSAANGASSSKSNFGFKSSFSFPLSDIWKARLLLLAAAALYGTNFSLVKILGDTMPVAISGTLRFGMASLVTLPWLLTVPEAITPAEGTGTAVHGHQVIAAIRGSIDKGRQQQLPKSQNWWDGLVQLISGHTKPDQQVALAAALAGFEVGMWNSVGYVAQAVGLETTAASKSAFLCSLAVVTVPILDYFVGKRLLPKQIIGALLAVAGVAFLELGGVTGNIFDSLNYGDLASLVQPLAFGMGFWRMENAMTQYPQHAARSTAAQMMAVFCAYAAYCAVACGVTHTVTLDLSLLQSWLTSPSILFSLFWTGVITTALTVYMETLALKTLSAAETTLIFSTEPLWGTAFAAYLMGEHLGFDAAMGAVLILSGCLYSNLGPGNFKAVTPTKEPQINIQEDPSLPETPAPVLVRSGIAGAIGSWVSGLGEVKCVAEVAAAAAAEELEHLDDVIQSVNEIL